MKLRFVVIAILCIGLAFSISIVSNKTYAQGTKAVVMPKITVLNPMGTPPPIKVKQMAPRLKTLDGKTIYVINTGFPNSGRLLGEVSNWFKANYPKTNIVMARAGMTNIPQNVMAEIKEKADAVILGVGH